MKLISLYIENFGGLHQFEQRFEDGLTVIREPNGFGKTTLAEFIRAMLYGFPRAARTLDKNKRKKYLPWNGGKCGGNLTFEWEGCQYRVERTFGATPKGDSFQLIDLATNKKSDRFSENLGVELFDLDAESFERSTYLPQLRDLGSLSTDSIRAKLGDLVEDTNDINRYDKAVAALKNKRSTFVPYRGNGGAVAEARSRVSSLQEELDRAGKKREEQVALKQELAREERALADSEEGLEQIRREIIRASEQVAAQSLSQQYEELLAQRQALSAETEKLPREVPTAEAFEEAQRLCQEDMTLRAALETAGLSPAEKAQLELLQKRFAAGAPDLEGISHELSRWNELRLAMKHQELSAFEQTRLDALASRFREGVPKEEELDAQREKLDRAAALGQNGQASASRRRAGAMMAGSLVLIVAAVIALVLRQYAVALALGVAAGVIGLLGCLEGRKAKANAAACRKARQLEAEVEGFVARFGGKSLAHIREDRAAYLELSRRRDGLEAARAETRRELEECQRTLEAELGACCGPEMGFDTALAELRLKFAQYRDLEEKQTAAAERILQLQARSEDLERRLRTFLQADHPMDPAGFQTALARKRREAEQFLSCHSRIRELDARLEQFHREHPILPEPEETQDLDALKIREIQTKEQMTRITRDVLKIRQTLANIEEELDRLPGLEDELGYWQEQKESFQANADTLDATLSYLEEAKERLSGNYLGTIQRSFGAYLERMMGGGQAAITSDLEVRLERQGQTRELDYFSAGQTDLVMLCMRMALVDALFAEVMPFVILDDPFVNLDDEHTKAALELLRELSRERQVIYLVCHTSRA